MKLMKQENDTGCKAALTAVALAVIGFVVFWALPVSFTDYSTSTVIESADGYLLGAKIAADGQWRFPAGDSLPEKYRVCVVAFEDQRFYYHPGVDPLAVLRALWVNVRNGAVVEGGSTLSMQTVRLMRKGKARTVGEKMIEALLAVRLEMECSKEEILRRYAAHAPFGGNVVGIEAAAWRYFGHAAGELSWAEAATLAVLPNAPSLIHPGRNRTQLLNKRNRLLRRLFHSGAVSSEDLQLAQAEPLPGSPLPLPEEAPHLLERIAQTHAGESLRTTIRRPLQQRTAAVVNRHSQRHRGNGVNNMAALVIENETGRVLAYVGNVPGREGSRHGEQVDMITSPRSTGSILKPFLFAALLDEGDILPGMLLSDVPTYINGFVPQNYDRQFNGAVPAHRALERSLNIPAVLLLQQYGVARFHTLLQQLGFSTVTYPPEHYGLSLILGGAEVTLWETANGYAAMARILNRYASRSGKYAEGDWASPLLLSNETMPTARLIDDGAISAGACWQIFESLSEVNRPEGEEEWQRFPSSRKVAWKTGTSYGNRDAWAVGVTPEYTIGVWVGNASGEGRPMLTGVTAAAPVLFDLFNLLPATTWFAPPYDELTRISVCRESGHRATEWCMAVDSIWILNAGVDSRPCPYHILVHLDRTESYRVTSDCEDPYRMVSKPWFVLPPIQEYFYRIQHPSYMPLPPQHPQCLPAGRQQSMALVYPQNGFHIVLTKQMDGHTGQLIMQATHRRRNATLYWHLNNHYLGSTRPPHQMPALPDTGRHAVTLVDDEGASINSYFYVEGK